MYTQTYVYICIPVYIYMYVCVYTLKHISICFLHACLFPAGEVGGHQRPVGSNEFLQPGDSSFASVFAGHPEKLVLEGVLLASCKPIAARTVCGMEGYGCLKYVSVHTYTYVYEYACMYI